MKDKICPFMHGTSVLGMNTSCLEDDCALWDDGDYPEIKRHAETVIEWIDSDSFDIDSVRKGIEDVYQIR